MPDAPFLDAHVHFWDTSVPGLRWEWLGGGTASGVPRAPIGAPRFIVTDLMAEAAGAGLAGVVHSPCAHPVDDLVAETRWLDGLADEHVVPQAFVGGCRLGEPDAPSVIRRHAGVGRVRGVRDPGSVHELDPAAAAPALAVAAELGLSVEVRRRHDAIDEIVQLAREWPNVLIVLSHACLPADRSASSRSAWASAMRTLAEHDNIRCKISAVAGAADPGWTPDSLRPWILTCVEAFGSQRCSLASNWPVDREFGTYGALLDAYREVTAELDVAERSDLFHRTAEQIYGLPATDPGASRDASRPSRPAQGAGR